MKILIDHSGYELNNIGDLAMLVACVRRLRNVAPSSRISVITVDGRLLAARLPDVDAVIISELPRFFPPRVRKRLRVRWKRRAKWLSAHGVQFLPAVESTAPRLSSLRRAIGDCDVLVAAGGGYVNDIFPAHGRGVLYTLRRAQRLGKGTAMFGQGIGPISRPLTLRLTTRVLASVDALTLREGVQGPQLLSRVGISSERYEVTGDEALLLAAGEVEARLASGATSRSSSGLGLNVRLAGYAGVSSESLGPVRDAVKRFLPWADYPRVVAVPIMSAKGESDLIATSACVPDSAEAQLDSILDPDMLVERASSCRALMTGSYHAAVFALAVGVPVVGISNSTYYDWKFSGLRDLYGDRLVRIVRLDKPHATESLMDELKHAWDLSVEDRQRGLMVTDSLLGRQDAAYRRVLAEMTTSNSNGRA